MTRLRFWVCVSFLWLALLLNVERLHEPINIASFVYVLSALLAVVTVSWAPVRRWQLLMLTATSLAVFVVLKASLAYAIAGPALPLTLTEAGAILTTIWLSQQIGKSIRQFEESVFELAALHWVNRPLSLKEMREQLYHEVRRARRHERPLSLVAVRPEFERVPDRVNELIAETHRRMAHHYLDVQFVDVLASAVDDFDLIAKGDGHFLLLLTEADEARVEEITDRVAQRVRASLGVDVRLGVATFPEEEVTLSGLLRRAESRLFDDAVAEVTACDEREFSERLASSQPS